MEVRQRCVVQAKWINGLHLFTGIARDLFQCAAVAEAHQAHSSVPEAALLVTTQCAAALPIAPAQPIEVTGLIN